MRSKQLSRRARRIAVGSLLSICLGLQAAASAAGGPTRTPAEMAAAGEAFAGALAAQAAGDAAGYLAGIERAAELLPDPTRLLYRLAAARLAAGDRAGALGALGRMVGAGFVRDPRPDAAFAALAADAGFLALMARMDALAAPLVASESLFEIDEKGGLVEGIAHDPFDGSFYFSCVHHRKVLRRAADGKVSELVPVGAHGLAAALGLALDVERRRLWVVSAGLPQAAGLAEAARDRSALFAFDLATGELALEVAAPPGKRWWNDLALAGDGTVYVSDSGSASIARVGPDGAVTTVVEGAGLRSPGGLALSADERALYVADWTNGLARVELATGELAWLAPPAGSTVLGIDGLRRVGGDLIAIQNGVVPHRIVRLALAADGRTLAAAELLERAVPGWDEPTLGVMVGGALVYVANSQWPRFGEDGATPDLATLAPPAIRRLPLPAPAADVSSLDWLAGCWSGQSGDTFMEEHWTTPAGGGLVGMHKDVTAGKMTGFEQFRIVAVEGEGICYLSSPGGAPPTPFCLVEQGPARAVFENAAHDFPQRILYWRDGERLRARIEGTVDGVARGEEWSWERCR